MDNQQPPATGRPPAPPALRCYNPTCRHTWYQREATPPVKCPGCQSRHWYDPNFTFRPRRPPREKEPTLPLSPAEQMLSDQLTTDLKNRDDADTPARKENTP